MAWLIHIVSIRGVYLTDYVGLWSYEYLPHSRGIAPSYGDALLFNAWMMVTSAAEWMIVGWILSILIRLWSRRSAKLNFSAHSASSLRSESEKRD
jgi:hypothetical protein